MSRPPPTPPTRLPTWNYAAVHLTGIVELITDRAGTLGVVEATVRAMESSRTPEWTPTARSRERFAQILPGVVAFRIRIGTQQSLFKLSQDSDAGCRGRVQDEFRENRNAPLADIMERVNP